MCVFPDVHGWLLVPVGQEVVEPVVAERLGGRRGAVPRRVQRLGGAWQRRERREKAAALAHS